MEYLIFCGILFCFIGIQSDNDELPVLQEDQENVKKKLVTSFLQSTGNYKIVISFKNAYEGFYLENYDLYHTGDEIP